MRFEHIGPSEWRMIDEPGDSALPLIPAADDPLWQGNLLSNVRTPVRREDKCEDGVHRLYEMSPPARDRF